MRVFLTRPVLRTYASKLVCAALTVLMLATVTSSADAHARNENYVWINVETDGLSGRFELTYEDMRDRLDIDLAEGTPDPAALEEIAEAVQAYIKDNFAFVADGDEIAFSFGPVTPAPGAEDRFAAFEFRTEPFEVPPQITLKNDILLSWEAPLHRSLAVVEYDRIRGVEYPMDHAVLAFGPNLREQVINFESLEPVLTPREFVWQGFLHVVAGPDHVLYILALLLAAVFVLRPVRQWEPVERFVPALWNAVIIVTLFAIAHSITLALTVLGIIQPNIQLIETLIAFSILAVAVNNLYPVLDHGRWALIVFFGLFHGMGFASAMSALQFRLVEPGKVLINFNIGIELGQILIVLIVLPIFYGLRATTAYRTFLFPGLNVAIIAIAGYWTVTRALGV